jgi:hypothetical protein
MQDLLVSYSVIRVDLSTDKRAPAPSMLNSHITTFAHLYGFVTWGKYRTKK